MLSSRSFLLKKSSFYFTLLSSRSFLLKKSTFYFTLLSSRFTAPSLTQSTLLISVRFCSNLHVNVNLFGKVQAHSFSTLTSLRHKMYVDFSSLLRFLHFAVIFFHHNLFCPQTRQQEHLTIGTSRWEWGLHQYRQYIVDILSKYWRNIVDILWIWLLYCCNKVSSLARF